MLRQIADSIAWPGFNERNWSISRTGDGALVRKDKITSKGSVSCASVIEHIALPSLTPDRSGKSAQSKDEDAKKGMVRDGSQSPA